MNFYQFKSKFLTLFGDLKYFKTPPCIVYQPSYYGLNLVKKIPILFNGIIKGKSCWLAESFLKSPDFNVILEID